MKRVINYTGFPIVLLVAVALSVASCHKSISSEPMPSQHDEVQAVTNDAANGSDLENSRIAATPAPSIPAGTYYEKYDISAKTQASFSIGVTKIQQFGSAKYATTTYLAIQKTKTSQQLAIVVNGTVKPIKNPTIAMMHVEHVYSDAFVDVYVLYDDWGRPIWVWFIPK